MPPFALAALGLIFTLGPLAAQVAHAATPRMPLVHLAGDVHGFSGRWSRIDTGDSSPCRFTAGSIYDPVRRRLIVFEGSDGRYQGDVWALSLSGEPVWTRLEAAGGPAPRRLVSVIYDPRGDRAILFGGFDDAYFNDVWAFSLAGTPAWRQLSPAGNPPAKRAGHTAIYDPVRQRMIVFGGYDGVSPSAKRRDDLWALSLWGPLAWSELATPEPHPSARSSHSAILDAEGDRMVVFGGTAPEPRNDVWALSLSGAPAWSELHPKSALAPEPRESHTAVYDPIGRRMVIFGGDVGGGNSLDDTWALTLDPKQCEWSTLHSLHQRGPKRRWGHGAIYDAGAGRMLIHGGQTGDCSDETWALIWK